jgi:hypothetical protein
MMMMMMMVVVAMLPVPAKLADLTPKVGVIEEAFPRVK